MENMEKVLILPKWLLINWPKIHQMSQILSAKVVCPSPKVYFNEKRLHWVSLGFAPKESFQKVAKWLCTSDKCIHFIQLAARLAAYGRTLHSTVFGSMEFTKTHFLLKRSLRIHSTSCISLLCKVPVYSISKNFAFISIGNAQ